MDDNIAIKVEGVYKNFLLPHEKNNSLKTLLVSAGKKKDKGYEVQHALKDISFDVKKGEFFGIVGRNGSGKSTLLKIIAEIYQPTSGSLHRNGKLVPFIELGVGFNAELTGRENVYLNGALLGFSAKEIDVMYHDIVQFAELERFMDQKLKNYSSGMQVRLAFSVATRAKADILLIDEVLAVGDTDFQRKCFNYFKGLRRGETTVVFVSHDMNAVREYCDRAILIDNSKIVAAGSSEQVASEYSKMFIKPLNKDIMHTRGPDAKRWGDGRVKFINVSCFVEKDLLKINARAKTRVKIDKILYGIHIVGPDGKDIVATNNQMISAKTIANTPGNTLINFEWTIQNIFTDGNYRITLTMVSGSGEVFDWFEDATSFRVLRPEQSTTSVLPPITVKITKAINGE